MSLLSRADGWWEDSDQLNLVAAFLDSKSIGAVACCCTFTRDNLRDSNGQAIVIFLSTPNFVVVCKCLRRKSHGFTILLLPCPSHL